MSYLKLIVNACWAGLYASILITFLIFFMNDGLARGGPGRFAGAALALGIFYLPAVALLLPTLFVCVRFFAARRLGIGWLTPKAIVWFGAASLGSLVAVYARNLRWAGSLLSPGSRDALRASIGCLAACWVAAMVCAGVAQVRPGATGRRYRAIAAAFLLLPLPVLGALAARLPSSPPGAEAGPPHAAAAGRAADARSLVIVGLEAASLDDILPLAAARELPEFERMLKEGAAARLNTIAPCSSAASWATLVTGMPPWATGVKGSRRYALRAPFGLPAVSPVDLMPVALGASGLERIGLARVLPAAPRDAGAPSLWQILRAAGVTVSVAGFPGADAGASERVVSEEDPRVAARLDQILVDAGGGAEQRAADPPAALLRRAIAADLSARDAALAARGGAAGPGPLVMAVFFPGLGRVSRHYLRYSRPADFGDVTPQEEARHGRVMARYYQFVDGLVAEQAEAAGPGARTLVVSAHGVEPASWWERLARPGGPRGDDDPPASGSWERGPDGALLILGDGLARGARVEEADIQDVVPTILYMLGMPIERGLRGGLIRRMFNREFLESHPMQLVPGRSPAF